MKIRSKKTWPSFITDLENKLKNKETKSILKVNKTKKMQNIKLGRNSNGINYDSD